MEGNKRMYSFMVWAVMAALLTPLISTDAAIFEDEKNFFYFPPVPHVIGTPPPTVGSHPSSPPLGSGVGHVPTPSHGTPPHSDGSYGSSPPANCGSPPTGGHHYPTPGHHDPTPVPPRRNGGGRGGYYHSPPSTPGIPRTPSNPSTPTLPRSPPFDPHFPFTGTCNFWRSHPRFIWGLFGWWGNVGGAFGVGGDTHGFGPHMTLLEALSNTRPDGVGALYREGTASLLNSMVNKRFPYTTQYVRDSFVTALRSNKAAAAQAQVFKLANEEKLTP